MGRGERPRGGPRRVLVNRGAIFWLDLEVEGRRPVCILTRDAAIPGLRNLVVALVTTRIRGLVSEVPLGPEDGMPRECAISLDNVRTVPKAQLTEEITRLGSDRIDDLCRALASANGC
jgi:mRNA interferase MazF